LQKLCVCERGEDSPATSSRRWRKQDRGDEEVKEREETAREEAEQAQQEYDTFANNRSASDSLNEAEGERQHRASEAVRGLYRKLVKLCHPDLTMDPQEKLRRTEFMKEIRVDG